MARRARAWELAWLAALARGGAGALGPLRRDHHRQPALLADRHPGNGRNAETPDRARSTSSSTGRARLGEVLQWPGMVGALGGVVLGFAFLRRRSALGIAAASSPSAPSPCSPAPAWRSSPATRCSPAAMLAIFVALALLGWRLLEPGHPWRRRWQLFAGLVCADVRRLAAEPVGPRLPGRHRPHQPGRGSSATSPTWSTPAPSSRSAARSPCPTTAPCPASPSASKSSRPRSSAPARKACPERGYFVAPASQFVIHNFILDPNDPTQFDLEVPHGFERGRRKRVLEGLPPLRLSRGVPLGGERHRRQFEAAAEVERCCRRRSSLALLRDRLRGRALRARSRRRRRCRGCRT